MKTWQAVYFTWSLIGTLTSLSLTLLALRTPLGKTPAAAFLLLWGLIITGGAFVNSLTVSALGCWLGWGLAAKVSLGVHLAGLAAYVVLLAVTSD